MTVKKNDSTISTFEFFAKFPNGRTAIEYFESRRWPDGICCPHCGSKRTSRLREYQYHRCKDCRKKFTVRKGTIFERPHIPLHKWLYAMYRLQTARKGISSVQLSKELGISQKSSWFIRRDNKNEYNRNRSLRTKHHRFKETGHRVITLPLHLYLKTNPTISNASPRLPHSIIQPIPFI